MFFSEKMSKTRILARAAKNEKSKNQWKFMEIDEKRQFFPKNRRKSNKNKKTTTKTRIVVRAAKTEKSKNRWKFMEIDEN